MNINDPNTISGNAIHLRKPVSKIKLAALRSALIEGEESGIAENYSLTGLIEELGREVSVCFESSAHSTMF
jgi:hypothetical protein